MAKTEGESTTSTPQPFSNILVQVHFDDPKEVAKKETGLKLSKEIYKQQWSSTTDRNFFAGRYAHQLEVEKWSLGKQDMMQFLSFMGVNDANKSEANIDMTPIMIGAQFSGTLVDSMSKNVEYPYVKAIDEDSMDEKVERQMEALFRMKEVDVINELQMQSGIQLEPSNVYVPDSELAAKVYFEQKDQLPKEIKFQEILYKAMMDNDYEKVLKPKLLRNNVVFNTEVVKVGRGVGKEYTIKEVQPKTAFYNFFQTDNGKTELSYIGQGYNLKVRDIRKLFGKDLTEEQIYKLAKMSSQNNPVTPLGFNHAFGQQFSEYSGSTPWDDYSIFVIDFEVKICESQYWVSKIDNYGKENISQKKGIPTPQSEKSKIIKKDKDSIKRAVYCPYADMILYWGKSELSDQFSYCINIPFNTGEYVPSLFERALEPMRELALVKLKKKLLISRLRPSGFRIDIEGAKNIVTGNGRMYEWEDVLRIYTVTGVELYSSKGLNPLESSNPAISSASRDDTLQNIIQLDQTEQNIISGIRSLLGAPIYLDGSNVGQRTAGKLADGQREASMNVTSFILNSHLQVMEEALNKICLLAWQDVVTDKKESSDDLINTKFKTYVKLRISDDEKMQMERDIALWSQTPDENGMPLISPSDAYAIRQIDDLKLAELYLAEKIDENRRKAASEKQKREDSVIKAQRESNQQASENEMQIQAQKLEVEEKLINMKGAQEKELKLLEIVGQCAAKGVQVPPEIAQLMQLLVPTIAIPIQMKAEVLENAMQEADQMREEQLMQQEEGGEQAMPEGQEQEMIPEQQQM